MHPTVYAAFPELNSTEVDALLHRNRAADELANLMSRTTGATAVTCCPPELLQQALELLPTTDSPEPIPFFEATLAVAHEDLTCLLGRLRDHELLSHPRDTLRSVLTATVSQMQNVLLRAQIQLASEHRLPDDQITCRTAEYTRLSTFLASKHGLRLFQERFPVAVHIARNIVRRRTDFILQLLDHTASDLPFLHELGVGNDVKEAYSQTARRPAKPLIRAHLRMAVNKPQGLQHLLGRRRFSPRKIRLHSDVLRQIQGRVQAEILGKRSGFLTFPEASPGHHRKYQISLMQGH